MVTTLTLPSSALGFTLDSNNQYIISVTLVMKEIIKMVASLNSSVSDYLRHHNIKYKYIFYINGTAWKSSNGYIDLTNTNVSFSNENISGYLSSSSLKQTLSCTVEVSHPQFYCKLNSENYTFVTINKRPQQLKALNSSTGQYETIGLSFSNLSSSEKSGIDSIRWPLFNTENSSQQFVIPIGSASYTRRNGSIRAERFGGSAGQYFNLDTNPSSNKDYRATNGTEYRYVDSFTPALRYYEAYGYVGYFKYTTTSSSEWANPTRAAPTLTNVDYGVGRYTNYAFGGWIRSYNFTINYFTNSEYNTPNRYYANLYFVSSPITETLPSSALGFSWNRYTGLAYLFGRDFTINYRKYLTDNINSTTWPDYEVFVTGGSVTLSGEMRYSLSWKFDGWTLRYGRHDYYYCVGGQGQRYFPDVRDRKYEYYTYSESLSVPERPDLPSASLTTPDAVAYYYSGMIYRYYLYERYYTDYASSGYTMYVRYYGYAKDTTAESFYEEFTGTFSHAFLGYYWYLNRTYTTKSSTITGTLEGNEYKYMRWWDYETRTNWYVDTTYNEIKYYNNYQVKITNDTNTYRTS